MKYIGNGIFRHWECHAGSPAWLANYRDKSTIGHLWPSGGAGTEVSKVERTIQREKKRAVREHKREERATKRRKSVVGRFFR